MSNNIGPTKRSADHNDYVELEAKLAQVTEDNIRLKDYNKKLLASLNNRDKLIKELEVKKDNLIDISVIREYVNLRSTAEKLRKENNEQSAKFGSNQESGSYKTPVNVIDAGLNWTRKSIEICNKIAEKLGL